LFGGKSPFKKARKVLEELLPYLIVKKEEASKILSLVER
jgi:hypothetical protein